MHANPHRCPDQATSTSSCRKLFQLPPLPPHHPQLATWQKASCSPITVEQHRAKLVQQAPSALPQAPASAQPIPGPNPDLTSASEQNLVSGSTGDPNARAGLVPNPILMGRPIPSQLPGSVPAKGPLPGSAPRAGPASSWTERAGADRRHYQPEGLRASPVAGPLAGPTIHCLLHHYVGPFPTPLCAGQPHLARTWLWSTCFWYGVLRAHSPEAAGAREHALVRCNLYAIH